ncbi:MAG: O-acetyl-ADP-ribose deacetylase [Nitrospirae bacterium]|nr:O-acetyl-ADP-ribose deacetylase [Nitrospirota bacterium]
MKVNINNFMLELVKGDITKEATEAIVNAANSGLRGGGGVDGAIHRAGGPLIMEECRKIGGCPTGNAVITSGGRLKAKYVIHAVGPIYHGGKKGEPELLASAYRNSLQLAAENNIKSISFPSLSTGAYGYPFDGAAPVALHAVIEYLKLNEEIEHVRFVLFGEDAYRAYATALEGLNPANVGDPETSSG